MVNIDIIVNDPVRDCLAQAGEHLVHRLVGILVGFFLDLVGAHEVDCQCLGGGSAFRAGFAEVDDCLLSVIARQVFGGFVRAVPQAVGGKTAVRTGLSAILATRNYRVADEII